MAEGKNESKVDSGQNDATGKGVYVPNGGSIFAIGPNYEVIGGFNSLMEVPTYFGGK